MAKYLKIENSGVCPTEGFILWGATSKRLEVDCPYTIGQFGSGNKHGVNVLLRNELYPVVFCGRHKLEFGSRPGRMKAVGGESEYKRVYVKHGGQDEHGTSVTFTEELSQTADYGKLDWTDVAMALREFVSNGIDAALAVNAMKAAEQVRLAEEAADAGRPFTPEAPPTWPWEGVKIELVDEEQVRAKRGKTRVFVPVNDDVIKFFVNIGKWFLHFSEPMSIMDTILHKASRNIGESKVAVIYRRGVRVREVCGNEPSLFDYNFNGLRIDESRNAEDYTCRYEAGNALAKAKPEFLVKWIEACRGTQKFWEHTFGYEIAGTYTPASQLEEVRGNWAEAVASVGDNVVFVTEDGPMDRLKAKGYVPYILPSGMVDAARQYNCPTPDKVLNSNDLAGRDLVEATPDAVVALDWVWEKVLLVRMDAGKPKPNVHCFRKVMDGGTMQRGFQDGDAVYINEAIASGTGDDLYQTMLEEVGHYLTGAKDESRDLQDWAFGFAVRIVKVLTQYLDTVSLVGKSIEWCKRIAAHAKKTETKDTLPDQPVRDEAASDSTPSPEC